MLVVCLCDRANSDAVAVRLWLWRLCGGACSVSAARRRVLVCLVWRSDALARSERWRRGCDCGGWYGGTAVCAVCATVAARSERRRGVNCQPRKSFSIHLCAYLDCGGGCVGAGRVWGDGKVWR